MFFENFQTSVTVLISSGLPSIILLFLFFFQVMISLTKFTVNFVSEIITCKKDKDNKIIEGNPDIIKTVNDVWKFSKNMWSQDPTWYLVETSNN